MAKRPLRLRLQEIWKFNEMVKAQQQMEPHARDYLVKRLAETMFYCGYEVGMFMDLMKRLPDAQLLDLANTAAVWRPPEKPDEALASPQGATKKGVTRLIGNLLMAHPAGQPALKCSKK